MSEQERKNQLRERVLERMSGREKERKNQLREREREREREIIHGERERESEKERCMQAHILNCFVSRSVMLVLETHCSDSVMSYGGCFLCDLIWSVLRPGCSSLVFLVNMCLLGYSSQ